MIFYLLPLHEWESSDEDVLAGPGAEPFVHCCDERQIAGVRRSYFSADQAVAAVAIDPTALDAETRYEPGSGGEPERFPHVYGPIPRSAVVDVRRV